MQTDNNDQSMEQEAKQGSDGHAEQQGFEPPAYIRAAHSAKPNWAVTPTQRMLYGAIASVAAVILIVVCVVGANTSGSATTTTGQSPSQANVASGPTDTPYPTVTVGPTPTPAPTDTPAPTATPTPSYSHFDDGTFQVGKDIKPGTYRTRAASPGCYYARLSGFGGSIDEIIANNNTDAPAVVTIATSDAGFESDNCGTWTQNLSQITASRSTFGDGIYIVGTDIQPGTYKNSGVQGCYYARLSGFGGSIDEIIANNNTDNVAIVTISASDKGFESNRCGTWTKDQRSVHRSTLINDYYKSFEVVHLQPTTYYYGNASLYGSGWQTFTDGYGQAGSYAWTTNRGSATAWAQLSASGNTLRCAVAVYVPAGQASANITFGVKMANGSWANRTINENNIDGWALLYKWGEISSAPVLINVGNNNGTTNQQLGVGYMIYIC